MKKRLNSAEKLHSSDIDFVVLWVDGNDPEWQIKKSRYTPDANDDVDPSRYRDWENLKFWFRGVAEFAPWVRKIHFVTDGQVPEWLDADNPYLHIVNHKDYMPAEILPVFNSNAIEVGIHNITGLSDKFVCFNDDMFLLREISPEYYFERNMPVDMPGITRAAGDGSVFGSLMMNNYRVLNRYFDKKQVLRRDGIKWFNPLYGKTFVRTCLNLNRNEFDGIVIPHLSVPYRRQDFERVWQKEGELLRRTQCHRFRDPDDLTHFLFRFWRLANGDYVPRKSRGRYFAVHNYDEVAKLTSYIMRQKCVEICINDCYNAANFYAARNLLNEAFEKILPGKCEYEK